MSEHLRYTLADGIAHVAMDDGKANVLSTAMLGALNAALDRAESDGAVVLISGRPGLFSGGFDLAVFQSDPAEVLRMLLAGARLTERLLAHPRPVVAACGGHAIAMGLFLLLSCDHRVGVDSGARLQANEVQIGLTLPHFAIEVCRQRLTPAHLVTVAGTAAVYDPSRALAAGMLDELCPADTLADTALQAARRLASLNPAAFAATKQRLRGPALLALRSAIEQDLADWTQRFAAR
jgi:enoyl-CoA hydratase